MAVEKKLLVQSVAVGLTYEWAGCCSTLSTPSPLIRHWSHFFVIIQRLFYLFVRNRHVTDHL